MPSSIRPNGEGGSETRPYRFKDDVQFTGNVNNARLKKAAGRYKFKSNG